MTNIDQVGQRAEALFQGGLNCCESVLAAVAEAMGIQQCECIPAVATGMGGGVGHTGGVCGAVTGAAMAIGLAASKMNLPDHAQEKQWANEMVTEMMEAFDREFNYTRCNDLIHIDFADPGWIDTYTAESCKQKCTGFVLFNADWVARRLAGEGL